MKRRAAAAKVVRVPFPQELLDVPLPMSPADRELVDAACKAAGVSPIGYLQLRVLRKRRLAAGASGSAPVCGDQVPQARPGPESKEKNVQLSQDGV